MRTLIITLLLAVGLLGETRLYEVRFDGVLCTLTGGSDRRILRKTPTRGSCHFPIPIQRQCLLSAFSDARTVRYDGDKIILTPLSPKEPAMADLFCESGL